MRGPIKDHAIRWLRDLYRTRGFGPWDRNDHNPITLLVDYRNDNDGFDIDPAIDALVFAAPGVSDFRALTEWCDAKDRTYAEVLAVIESADGALNGDADA